LNLNSEPPVKLKDT